MYNFERMLQIAAKMTGWVKIASGFVDPRTFCLRQTGSPFLKMDIAKEFSIINAPNYK